MIIREIYIEGFGRLSKMKLNISDGLNILKRENGFGKTTLTVFIKAMLYGLDRSKKQSVTENDRKHYLPWSKGKCGGSLTLEAGGRLYRIERTFGTKAAEDTFKLYDLATGKESSAFTERIGEELFGVDEDGFLRTVFLSEENLGGSGNKTVAAKLTSLVGCDGDISSLDKALLALEEERKIYHKRGGGGEIAELGRRAAELDARIAEKRRLEKELRESEAALAEASHALRGAKHAREAERIREAEAGRERVRRAYVKQYAAMSRTLSEDEERGRALEEFFSCGIPSQSEIETVREKISEASLLSRRAESIYSESAVFGKGVLAEEYERAAALTERLSRLDGEIAALEGEHERVGFVTDLPSRDEIEKAQIGIKKRGTLSPFLPISAIIIIAAAVLGYLKAPIFYLGAIPALILFFIGMKLTAKNKKRAKNSEAYAKELIKRVTGRDVGRDDLDGMLAELARIENASAERREGARVRSERIAALKLERAELFKEAEGFIAKFDGIAEGSVQSRINDILIKRRASIALSGERYKQDLARRDAESRAAELMREVTAFLSGFKTSSDRPLDEISSKLNEREALLRTLERTRAAVNEFRLEHGITDADLALLESDAPISTANTQNAEGEVSRHEARLALLERKCRDLSAELIMLEGVEEEQEALLSRKAEYEKKLRVITKTKELLIEASDSLTSRYLSRTKEAFLYYLELMNRELSGGFSMNTSFELMRSEGGEYKEAEAYSRGTRDLYSLALRFALIDTLYEGERPFIILDDPFAHLDDTALKNAKAVIKAIAKGKQIIYLTCSDARGI